MRESYTIWLPGLPPKIANRRNNHWTAYYRERKRWMAGAAPIVLALRPEVAQKLSVRVVAYVPRLQDQDNADGSVYARMGATETSGPTNRAAESIAHLSASDGAGHVWR